MKFLPSFLERALIYPVELFKKVTGLQTYVFEYVVVLGILVATALVSNNGIVEWIGVAAVFFSFAHMSVAERLREREEHRHRHGKEIGVDCFYKLNWYYYLKEICWLAYFTILGAWSALVGVIVFLLYGSFRKIWRKHHPLSHLNIEED